MPPGGWSASISVALVCCALWFACGDSPSPTEVRNGWVAGRITSSCFALVNGVVLDGNGAPPIQPGGVVVRGNSILDVGPTNRLGIPSDAEIVDVNGATILPGFINAHVHSAFSESRLRTWAWNGVTTVRDEAILTAMSLEQAVAFRDSVARNPECATLISAGYMMTVPGGYGNLHVTSPADARQKTLWELDKGVDLVKVAMEDGYAGNHGLAKLSETELASIVMAAHERGTLVSAHITQSQYWKTVVDAGVDDVAHVAYDPVQNAVLDKMVMNSIVLVPTFTIFRNYGAPVSVCIDNVRRFLQKGGTVALGNDFSGGPGSFDEGIPFYELDCMVQAGMTPMQIIVASTRTAARVAHCDSALGTIEAGKVADLVVVKGDPLVDLDVLSKPSLVIHRGINIRSEE